MISMKEAFERAEVLCNANPDSVAKIASFAILKNVKKHEHLFFDKDEVEFLYILVEGRVSLYKINSLGDKKVIFVYGKGKMLNEVMLQDLPASINCEVLEDSWILCLPKEKFWKVMEEDSKLTKAVIDSMALKIRRLYRQLKNTTNTLNGEKRLAAKLFKLAKDHGKAVEEGIRIDMNLTITYLAEMLGSKRETVSRQIKLLVEAGLIKVNRNQITVLDLEKLRTYFKTP